VPDPHEILPEPAAPPLPGSAIVRPTRDDAIDALCADLSLQAQGCVQAFGDFHLAVDPADAMTAVIVRLMVDPLYRGLPWASTHVWPTREGPHPPHDERSGYRALCELLADHAGIPPGQVHPIPVGEARADEAFEGELRRVLGRRERGHDRLDFALLGVDASGVVGGLTGGAMARSEGLAHAEGDVVCVTLGALNACRCLAVLATGAEARAGFASPEGASVIASLSPLAGELRWYLDHDACAEGGSG